MGEIVERDVVYTHDSTRMVGWLCAPAGAAARPTVVLVHDAFGLGPETVDVARRLAALGYPVLAADVWGERTQPADESQIGPLIGSMVGDRPRWIARVAAAHAAAAEQPEVDASALATLGYCVGASGALEHLRAGGDVRGVVSIHGGLDLLDPDWTSPVAPGARVLVCSGADDPMATGAQRARLQEALSGAGVDWQVDLYSDTKHAFTSKKTQDAPANDVFGYNARSAARAWDATTRFLQNLFADEDVIA